VKCPGTTKWRPQTPKREMSLYLVRPKNGSPTLSRINFTERRKVWLGETARQKDSKTGQKKKKGSGNMLEKRIRTRRAKNWPLRKKHKEKLTVGWEETPERGKRS